MAETELLWHQACDILHLHGATRENGWPDSLNIEQIAQLHFDGDKVRERALLSLLRTEIKKGRLRVSGADHIPGVDYSEAWLYNQLLGGYGTCEARDPRDIPTVSREAYAQWQGCPSLDGSILRGWITPPDAPRPTVAPAPAGNTAIPGKGPIPRREELQRTLAAMKEVDSDLDIKAMPGTKADFLAMCKELGRKLPHNHFTIAQSSFDGVIKGWLKFRPGAASTAYYRDRINQVCARLGLSDT